MSEVKSYTEKPNRFSAILFTGGNQSEVEVFTQGALTHVASNEWSFVYGPGISTTVNAPAWLSGYHGVVDWSQMQETGIDPRYVIED